MRSILNFLLSTAAIVLFVALCTVVMIEWMSGCGETYVDAKGERHAYECVFIPQPSETDRPPHERRLIPQPEKDVK